MFIFSNHNDCTCVMKKIRGFVGFLFFSGTFMTTSPHIFLEFPKLVRANLAKLNPYLPSQKMKFLMLPHLLFYIIIGFLCGGTSSLEIVVPESQISEVSIGGNIAEVSRTFTVKNVPIGFHTLIVNHVPNTLNEKSLQVTGLGAAEVLSTVMQNQVVQRENDVEFNQLIKKIATIYKQVNAEANICQKERDRINKRISVLNAYVQDVVHAKESYVNTNSALALDKLTEVLDYQDSEFDVANAKFDALESKLSSANSVISLLATMQETMQNSGFYKNLLVHDLVDIEQNVYINKYLHLLPAQDNFWPKSKQVKQLHINIHVPTNNNGKVILTFKHM